MPIIATASTICRQLYHARGRPVAGYARADMLDSLKRRFAYAFEGQERLSVGRFRRHCCPTISISPAFRCAPSISRTAPITSAGLRFDAGGVSIGYSTDFNELTDEMAVLFDGLDVWIVDALRRRPHPTHPHLADTLEWIRELRPKRGDPDPYGQQHGLSHLAAPSCPTGSSRAMTGWRSNCEQRRPSRLL